MAKPQPITPPLTFALQWCDAKLAIVLPDISNRKLIVSIAGLEFAAWLLILSIRSLRETAPVAATAVNIVLGLTGILLSTIYTASLVMIPFFALIIFFGRARISGKEGKFTRSLIATAVLLALNWKIFTSLFPLLTLYGFFDGVR